MAVLLCACTPTGQVAGVGDRYGRLYVDIVVESDSWDAKQVDILCDDFVIDAVYGVTHSVAAKSRAYINYECPWIQFAIMTRYGERYAYVTELIPVSSGDKIVFTIRAHLPLSTFRFIYREDHDENPGR